MADTNAVIMTAIVVTAGSTLVADQQDSKLTFKPIVGGWILGLILFIVATFAEDLARMFAILIMVTALLVNGSKLFGVVNKVTTTKTVPLPNTSMVPTVFGGRLGSR